MGIKAKTSTIELHFKTHVVMNEQEGETEEEQQRIFIIRNKIYMQPSLSCVKIHCLHSLWEDILIKLLMEHDLPILAS